MILGRYPFATFARDWQFNALGFSIFSILPSPVARALSLVIIAALVAAAWLWQLRAREAREARTGRALLMAFGALLFFSPVVNPWYLLWLLPIACAMWDITRNVTCDVTCDITCNITRYATPWAAACVLPLSYASDFNLGFASASDGRLPLWASVVQWVVIVAAAAWDWRAAYRLHLPPNLTETNAMR